MKLSVTTPGFPRLYPDNMNCFSFIVAPNGYRILIEFEEFVVEQEPSCAYDFVEMFELTLAQNLNGTSRHISQGKINGFSNGGQQQQLTEFQQLLHGYKHRQQEARNIFQPSNSTYNVFIPPPSTLDDRMPRRMCGDWSSKLKLLRHRSTSNLLGIRFSSDYSHHYGGFKAKISLEKGTRAFIKFSPSPLQISFYDEDCFCVFFLCVEMKFCVYFPITHAALKKSFSLMFLSLESSFLSLLIYHNILLSIS
jgi:hypothetical protein